jgi:competence ComEA-like helix-hairpin-helix protein
MNKIFKHWLRIYNNFSKGDRNSIIILGILILLINAGILIVNNLNPKSKYDYTQYEKLIDELAAQEKISELNKKSLFIFNPNTISPGMLDTLDLPKFIKNNLVNYRNAGGKFSSPSDFRRIYGMNDSIYEKIKNYISIEKKVTQNIIHQSKPKIFMGMIDPNSADFDELLEFGFNRFQSKNIVEYRGKGGVFAQKADLLKIYGIDSGFFKMIESNILIDINEYFNSERINNGLIKVELNNADTTELLKLAGIGSVYANRIIKYRDLLGGFYTISQLLEVYNLPEETFKGIKTAVSVDTLLIRKIRINFAEYAELLRHPYINKKQVEAILYFRNQKGSYVNLEQLESEGLLNSETFRKIKPYLTCR